MGLADEVAAARPGDAEVGEWVRRIEDARYARADGAESNAAPVPSLREFLPSAPSSTDDANTGAAIELRPFGR